MELYHEFLPLGRADMEARGWDQLDFVLVTGDAYVDHPSFGPAIIGRVLEAEDSVVGGYRICREEILTEKPPQAVFAVSDELAMGVIKAAREENISLPEGLAVAGFTGSEAAAVITPALTTMEHPLERLGAVAARRLIELIEDSALYQVEAHEIVLKSKLKIRRSCGNRKEIYELFE